MRAFHGSSSDGLEVGADDLGLHRLAADPAEPAELAVDFRRASSGRSSASSLLAELLEVVRLVVLAQFLADGLELLAQEHLALALAQLFLDLRLDVLLRVEHADLALEVDQHAAEPLLDREGLEQAPGAAAGVMSM